MTRFSKVQAAIRRRFGRLAGTEPVVLLVVALVATSLLTFVGLANQVVDGDTRAFDRWMMYAMRSPNELAQPIGPSWLNEAARDATSLGGTPWLVFFTAVVAVYLWLAGKAHMMLFALSAAVSGAAVSMSLKSLFSRPRPDLVPHLTDVYTSSFPSGHSMLSAVVYLTLGSLVAAVVPSRTLKVYVLSIAIFLTAIV